MRTKIAILIAALCIAGCAPRRAAAQFTGFTAPQSTSAVVMNAVTGTTATPTGLPSGGCKAVAPGGTCQIDDLGQTFSVLLYTTTGLVTNLDIRLEGSLDGVNFFPVSNDATSSGSGAVFANGWYPKLRANLVSFAAAGGITLTAQYVGTSTNNGPLFGNYSAAQTFEKPVIQGQAMGTGGTFTAQSQTGSSLGYLIVSSRTGAAFPAGSTFTTSALILGRATAASGPTYAVGGLGTLSILLPASAVSADQISVFYHSGGASVDLFDAYFVFIQPGQQTGISSATTQPLSNSAATLNTETTSAVATAATVTITGISGLRAHLFSVSARCSAGTSAVTATDGVTQIWSTAAAEVGTTTFKFQWNPGLASSAGNSMVITLGSCGAGNTGTLDVQASQQ
jgi:hypothetical protein